MAQPEKTLRLILGDQLHALHSGFAQPDDRVTFVIMEVRQETDYVTHHIQKVAAFFAAMRAFSAHLQRQGHRVIYLRLDLRSEVWACLQQRGRPFRLRLRRQQVLLVPTLFVL